MSSIKRRKTPEPTLRRLARYFHYLQRLIESKTDYISSTSIAEELNLDPTQVRKDIEYTGIVGKPKTGFSVPDLILSIQRHLSWDSLSDTFLAGVGSLGTAMLGYTGFKKYGLQFVAAFDNDELKISKQIHNVPVFSIDRLDYLARKMNVKVGVLTVPAFAAQNVADLMIKGGIKAIWNFAPIQLKVPEAIIVENAQITQSLAVLSRKIIEIELI
jgi:redox-sensing transcriptional repressor